MVPINYLAVLVCGVSNMVIGFLWYGPLFGKAWMKLSGMTQRDLEGSKKKGMSKGYAMAFVGALLMAFVLDHALIFASSYLGVTGIMAGLTAGFWNWLGFVAPVTMGVVLWEGKPWKYWLITYSYYLVGFLLMGSILAVWM